MKWLLVVWSGFVFLLGHVAGVAGAEPVSAEVIDEENNRPAEGAEIPESKPVEGQQIKVPKKNGGAITVEIRGNDKVMVAPGGNVRILRGAAPKAEQRGKAEVGGADKKAGDAEKDGDPPAEKNPQKEAAKDKDAQPAKDKDTAEQESEKKTTEDKIAAFLKKREDEARQPRTEQMQRRIEELKEIVGLGEAQMKKLGIASKGAVEKSLEPWREQMDSYIRQYLQRAPQNVDMMLNSIGNVNFGHTPEQEAAEQKVWLATIGRVLDEKQMVTYQATVEARENYLHSSVSTLLIADLDRTLRLSEEQRDQLAALLLPVVKENLPGLGRWSNDGNLPVYQLPTLLGGVAEDDLKKVLSGKQIEGWRERFARFKNMWQSMEQQKENVRKEAEEKAAAEKAAAEEIAKSGEQETGGKKDEKKGSRPASKEGEVKIHAEGGQAVPE